MADSEMLTAQLAAMADRQAITDLIYRYCRSMDRIDHELGYSLWHDDATADYGDVFKGSGRGFIDWACEQHSAMLGHSHQVSNILLELAGDSASSESYVTATLRFVQEGKTMQIRVHGRYLDRWVRRSGRWAIAQRVYVQDLDEIAEVTTTGMQGGGSRDRHDPSYQFLAD